MSKRGRDAISLPPLPMKFKEALKDYLAVKPEPEPESSAPPKRQRPKPETKRKQARKKAKR